MQIKEIASPSICVFVADILEAAKQGFEKIDETNTPVQLVNGLLCAWLVKTDSHDADLLKTEISQEEAKRKPGRPSKSESAHQFN